MSAWRAVAIAVALLVAIHAAWLGALGAERFLTPLAALLSASPFLAGFVAALFARRRRVVVGAAMAIPATIVVVASHALVQWSGRPVDFAGREGMYTLGGVALVWSGFSALVGGIAAYLLVRIRNRTEVDRGQTGSV